MFYIFPRCYAESEILIDVMKDIMKFIHFKIDSSQRNNTISFPYHPRTVIGRRSSENHSLYIDIGSVAPTF